MNHREFFDLTAKMRAAQQEYFRTHNPLTLRRCKALEREIDREIQRVRLILTQT